MSELARKIVHAIRAGDAHESQMAFEAAAAEKMIASLDAKRAQVARDMFREATGVENEAALDAMRVQEEGVSHEDGTFRDELSEGVSTYDIEDDIRQHASLHSPFEKSQPGHGKRVVDHEESISQRHGQKALQYIRDHTKLAMDYNEHEEGAKAPMEPEVYKKTYAKPMADVKKKVVSAALAHQMKK